METSIFALSSFSEARPAISLLWHSFSNTRTISLAPQGRLKTHNFLGVLKDSSVRLGLVSQLVLWTEQLLDPWPSCCKTAIVGRPSPHPMNQSDKPPLNIHAHMCSVSSVPLENPDQYTNREDGSDPSHTLCHDKLCHITIAMMNCSLQNCEPNPPHKCFCHVFCYSITVTKNVIIQRGI